MGRREVERGGGEEQRHIVLSALGEVVSMCVCVCVCVCACVFVCGANI